MPGSSSGDVGPKHDHSCPRMKPRIYLMVRSEWHGSPATPLLPSSRPPSRRHPPPYRPVPVRNAIELLAPTIASSLAPTHLAPPQPAGSHFFAGASNFTLGQFSLNYATDPAEGQRVQLLVQLLQANLAHRGLSQPVGYNRENGVRIVDALGGELILPPSIMGQYSDVHELILKHFRGKLGEERVVESRYCIVTEQDGTPVQPEDWDLVLNSGEGLVMCMTVEKVWVESVKDTCPQCGKTRLGTFREELTGSSGKFPCHVQRRACWLEYCSNSRRCQKRFRSSADSISSVRWPPISRQKQLQASDTSGRCS
ncbi:hypothetical protein FA13DRAFT_476287 [Coprinellus micaceus]|uniref:Ubiquitin-like domain-containing protein n=1 Tax=Coprinellus micaceus TaxID=71717 RepID=A0A4Y7TAN7_COPMI|nr:hypothetical protein FA13DRAFT_476287 [Coprinellus micaceus]